MAASRETRRPTPPPQTPMRLLIPYQEAARPTRVHRAPENFTPGVNVQSKVQPLHPHARARSIHAFVGEQLRRMSSPTEPEAS